jgi:hypothetical protein
MGSFGAKRIWLLTRHFNAVCETHVLEHDSEVPKLVWCSTAVEDAYALPKFTPCSVTLMPPVMIIFMLNGLAPVITGLSNVNMLSLVPTTAPTLTWYALLVACTLSSRLSGATAQRIAVSVSHTVLAHRVVPTYALGLGFALMKFVPYSVTLVRPEVGPLNDS